MRSTDKTRDEDATLEAIYGAALAPEKWPEALRLVAEELSATSAFYFSTHSDTNPGAVLHVHNQPWEMLNEFGSYWHTQDEWALAAHRRGYMQLRPGIPSVIVGSELVPKAQLSKTPFFNEFCVRHDMTEMVGTILFDGREEDGMPFTNLCLYRPPNQPEFQAAQKEKLARLLPHFRRAARIERRVSALVHQRAHHSWAAMRVAAIVLGADGAILHSNPAGQEFLQSLPAGCVQFGELRAIGAKCSPDLKQALTTCSASAPVRIAAYLSGSHARVIGATLVCLPLHIPSSLRQEERHRYLLLVDPPRASGSQLAASVAGVFGLSMAEVRVLGGLLDGKAPADIAIASGTSLPTIRTQIGSLLTKTGTRGQIELVLLMRDIRQ